jgi:hypothetical protein
MESNQAARLGQAASEGDVHHLEKHGFPTFDQFLKNPEKYLGHSEEILSSADVGSHLLRQSNLVRKHKYEIMGYRVSTLTEVQKIMKDHGINPRTVDLRPQIQPLGGGQCDILVKFTTREEREHRAGW